MGDKHSFQGSDTPESSDQKSLPGRLRAEAKATSHAEVVGGLARGGYLKSAIIEEEEDGTGRPLYTCFLLLSWRPGYHILHVGWPLKETKRPRQFRDLDRLVGLVRRDFGYRDAIALRMAGGTPGQKVTRFRAG